MLLSLRVQKFTKFHDQNLHRNRGTIFCHRLYMKRYSFYFTLRLRLNLFKISLKLIYISGADTGFQTGGGARFFRNKTFFRNKEQNSRKKFWPPPERFLPPPLGRFSQLFVPNFVLFVPNFVLSTFSRYK